MSDKVRIAVLDDYQGVALEMADWSVLQAEVTVFRDHISDSESLVQRLKPFDVICLMRERTPLPISILEQLPNLKLISFTGRRNPTIDTAYAKEREITVCNTESTASHGADELTWALVLAAVRSLPRELDSVKRGGWQVSIGSELQGKTIGIVGLGRIGGTTAKIAHAFEMNVIAWSQNLTKEKAASHGARLVTKEELFQTADIVTVHLVLSERTRGIIGAKELGLMKRSAIFVNTSRGPIVDEKALVDCLRNHRIAAASLDVYDTEPLPENHPFRSLDNVLATPHIGFVTKESYKAFYEQTVENVLSWLKGEPTRVIQS